MIIRRRKSAGLSLLILLVMLLMSPSCSAGTAGTVMLESKVTIGPLQPVVRPGVTPGPIIYR